MLINCRSIRRKQSKLEHLIRSHSVDITLCMESWQTEEINSREIVSSDFVVYRKDRRGREGGVFIAVKDTLNSNVEAFAESDKCEIVWCSIMMLNSRKMYYCLYYRPPNEDTGTLSILSNSIQSLIKRKKDQVLFIGGDFNLPSIDWESVKFI